MPRTALVLLALALSANVHAQSPSGAVAVPQAHELPFPTAAPETHTLELAVGGTAGEALTVAVAAAPDWLVFPAPSAAAARVEGETAEPMARLAFSVDARAPVGEAAAVELVVTDDRGVERARHAVRLVVAAPELALRAPWPNPSRGAATVAYTVPSAGPVRLSVVDVLGREVMVLADGARDAGAYQARVPARSLAAGTYAVVLRTERERRVRRLTVAR